MKKNFFTLLLLFVLCLPMKARALESVSVQIPSFPVTLNGQVFDSSKETYPIIVYKDITYVPTTYYLASYLGLQTNWTSEDGLSVNLANSVYKDLLNYIPYVDESARSSEQTATLATGKITVNGQVIDNATEPYPILLFRDITYFPLTWRFCHTEFGWSYQWDTDRGLRIVSASALDRAVTWNDSRYFVSRYTSAEGTQKTLRVFCMPIGTCDTELVYSYDCDDGILFGRLILTEGELFLYMKAGSSLTTGGEYLVNFSQEPPTMRNNPSRSRITFNTDVLMPEDVIRHGDYSWAIMGTQLEAFDLSAHTDTLVYQFGADSEPVLEKDGDRLYVRYRLNGETMRMRVYGQGFILGEPEKVE